MQSSDFFARRPGAAPLVTATTGILSVHDLGVLRVPSGTLGVADPFVALDFPITVEVPAGDHPVEVTLADVSAEHDGTHLVEAYLSLVLSDEPTVTVEPVPSPDGAPEPGSIFGVAVDADAVAFFDAEAVETSMPDDGDAWYDDVFNTGEHGSWFDILDSDGPLHAGAANIVMPLATAGENVVMTRSGWGDGVYPVLQTRDADGRLTGVHIDLRVVGSPPDADAAAESTGWLSRMKKVFR